MTRSPARLMLWTALLYFATAHLAPMAQAEDYLLFASSMDSAHGWVFRMDGDCSFSQISTPKMGYCAEHIAVSPNGRTVVANSFSTPTLSVFSIHEDGSLAPPAYLTYPVGFGLYYVAFHPTLPLFYIATNDGGPAINPRASAFRFDRQTNQIETTGLVKDIGWHADSGVGYSPWCGRLVYQTFFDLGVDGLNTVPVNPDGSLGEPAQGLKLPVSLELAFSVSPDGRWAVGSGGQDPSVQIPKPEMMFFEVGRDGAIRVADTLDLGANGHASYGGVWDFKFSPDSRRLYALTGNPKFLICYDIDQQTGKLTEHSALTQTQLDFWLNIDLCLALTPDCRYAAFRDVSDPDYTHNTIHLVRLNADGSMEYLPGKGVEVDEYIESMAFAPLPHNAAGPQWALYE